MNRRFVVFLLVGALLSMPMIVPGAQAQTPVAGLEWAPCDLGAASAGTPATDAAAMPAGLECATLAVPLDYADPTGEQISIGMNRLPATDPDQRIGSLVFNPGGPGGIASGLLVEEALGTPVFTPAVREHFDIIGMDPRGVGRSTPVRCDPDVWNEDVSRYPGDEAAFQRLLAKSTAVGESCLRLTGPLLGHLDTDSAARDIEMVRIALGDEPLNYLGLSYGSQLGATYAALYPDNIRAMALDGALDHAVSGLNMLDIEMHAHERELARFAQWCDETAACTLHGQDVLSLYDALVAEADRQPIPAPGCVESGYCQPAVTGEDIRFAAQELLLFKNPTPAFNHPGWEGLAAALAAARDGDASGFSPYFAQSETDGQYAGLAIECVDWPTDFENFDDVAAAELLARFGAPHTQGATQSWTVLTGCMGWPVPVANPPRTLDVQGTPPILIVNATYDPSTAYVWAQLMREQIEGSVLLTRDGDGHTSYLLPGESQTRDAIDTYLVSLELPAPNTVYES